MEKNIGKTDKTFRVLIGVLIAAIGYYYDIWWLYLVALLPIISVVTGYCPPYKWFGMNTNKK